jgi:hypothetical protein
MDPQDALTGGRARYGVGKWLWRQPLPDPVQVLLEIDRDAYMRYLHNRMHQAGS